MGSERIYGDRFCRGVSDKEYEESAGDSRTCTWCRVIKAKVRPARRHGQKRRRWTRLRWRPPPPVQWVH